MDFNKYIVCFVKYIPVIINVWILFILLGVISDKMYPIFGQSILFNALLYLLSIKYKLCFWHKSLIFSMTFCLIFEFFEINGIFLFEFINNIKLTVCLIGLLIFTVYGTQKN